MAAYYNEIDPFAAQWLRNLIAAGRIPEGEVDERSVLEVDPGDLRPFRQCHFFAGIAGWAHALDLAGWPSDRAVWTGSVPCQPLSSAGQRRGHADERHLWPAFHELIAECRPATLFGEQVASKLGREWFSGVRADLEHLGFAVGGADLPAACVGAPHIRQRLYWVANADVSEQGRREQRFHTKNGSDRRDATIGERADVGLADAERGGREHPRRDQREHDAAGRPERHAALDLGQLGEGCGAEGGVANAEEMRRSGRPTRLRRETWGDVAGSGGGLADTQRDDRGPDLKERRPQGRALDFWADAVWLQCLDGKARRIEPTIQPLATGIRNRVGLLRGSGNSIVPQAAAVFITAVMEAL